MLLVHLLAPMQVSVHAHTCYGPPGLPSCFFSWWLCCLQAALVLRGDAKAVAQQLAAPLRGTLNRERFAHWADGLRQQVRGCGWLPRCKAEGAGCCSAERAVLHWW